MLHICLFSRRDSSVELRHHCRWHNLWMLHVTGLQRRSDAVAGTGVAVSQRRSKFAGGSRSWQLASEKFCPSCWWFSRSTRSWYNVEVGGLLYYCIISVLYLYHAGYISHVIWQTKNMPVQLVSIELCHSVELHDSGPLSQRSARAEQYAQTKTNTNPDPDPNRYRRRCPDPNARI